MEQHNGEGMLGQDEDAEDAEVISAALGLMGSNGDGVVQAYELIAALQQKYEAADLVAIETKFRELDADENRRLDRQEVEYFLLEITDALEADRDDEMRGGVVSDVC